MGRLEQAEEAFLQAIAADPNVAAPFFHLGEIYEQQGQKDRAVEQYQKYLAIAPPDDQFRAAAIEAIAKLK
jgi:predicted TPR repeat methyltransferase